ncbi:chaperone modulator CbpM [Cupriavidus sp. CuC1]|uniref:chaperone modulator CbpM n=1 Tax=Cupriavidus sp. CuC1 TaxID=3373131 RepID=UPI0037CE9AC4
MCRRLRIQRFSSSSAEPKRSRMPYHATPDDGTRGLGAASPARIGPAPSTTAAQRLTRDLELGAVGVALVLDLLDEIDSLRARLRRANLA